MTARLNDQDWELLSAFIDGRLSLTDKAKIEQRLQVEAELRSAYTSLMRTRVILRTAPKVKRRRNFYLTPAMVRPRGWVWIIPVLNFSSAAAAILAVFLIFLDIFLPAAAGNQVSVLSEAAPAVQDLVVRPAAAAPMEPKISPDLSLENTTAPEQGAPLGFAPDFSQITEIPSEKMTGNAASEAVEPNPVLEPAAPQMLAVPPQTDQSPEEMAVPSMKTAQDETPAKPAEPPGPLPEGRMAATPDSFATSNEQPTGLPLEKAAVPTTEPVGESVIEPTGSPAENIFVPSPAGLSPAETQPLTTEPEQKIAEIPAEKQPALQAPTAETNPSVGRIQALPISTAESWVKFGWISLLFISAVLAALSFLFKKKSLS